MSKRYGPPYDPALRQTEHGISLYNAWRTVRRYPHCEEWDYFPTFYDWSLQNGFVLGSRLHTKDDDKPFSPDNCEWHIPEGSEDAFPPGWADEWNKTVNRIRKHYGLPLFGGDEDA